MHFVFSSFRNAHTSRFQTMDNKVLGQSTSFKNMYFEPNFHVSAIKMVASEHFCSLKEVRPNKDVVTIRRVKLYGLCACGWHRLGADKNRIVYFAVEAAFVVPL